MMKINYNKKEPTLFYRSHKEPIFMKKTFDSENLTMLTDLYQLTMMYGYFKASPEKMNEEVVFDVFFRKNPFQNGYSIVAGLEQAIDYVKNLSFSHDDIQFLRQTELFNDEDFFKELRNLRFTGEIFAMPEGTIAFPNEPIVRVKTRIFEAQLMETALLAIIGSQSLIATKANRIVNAAKGRPVMEFGARRAQGTEASITGARAAIIGGCSSTSNVYAAKRYDITSSGTHAHSWVMSFNSELEAFRAYAKSFPDNLILLVDTYDVLHQGIPNAIKVFDEVHRTHGKPKAFGIRIDSGDITYLSKKAREMLNNAGYPDAKIVISNNLDEYVITDIQNQGAEVDAYGVGTKLITAFDQPAMGCVYKLSAKKENDTWIPTLKRSENVEKITNPGVKKVLRFFDQETEEAIVDLIMLDHEEIPKQPFEVFDPVHTWKRKIVDNASYKELLKPIFINGDCIYETPTLQEIQENVRENLSHFSSTHTRLNNPHEYHVDLSLDLWNVKMNLLKRSSQPNH